MAIEYTWTINSCDRIQSTGGVYKVKFTVTGVEDGYTRSLPGIYLHRDADGNPTYPNPGDVVYFTTGWINYEDITQGMMITWCKADGVQERLEDIIAQQINDFNKYKEGHAKGLPWD